MIRKMMMRWILHKCLGMHLHGVWYVPIDCVRMAFKRVPYVSALCYKVPSSVLLG